MLNFSLVVSFATILTLLTTAATGRVTRMPVEVAQDGTIVHYLYDPEHDDIAASVINFCQTHLPSMNIEECSKSLLHQVQKFEKLKEESREALPSITFSVQAGQDKVRFAHVRGNDPAIEAASFCNLHFPESASTLCIDEMLKNMERALQEAQHPDG